MHTGPAGLPCRSIRGLSAAAWGLCHAQQPPLDRPDVPGPGLDSPPTAQDSRDQQRMWPHDDPLEAPQGLNLLRTAPVPMPSGSCNAVMPVPWHMCSSDAEFAHTDVSHDVRVHRGDHRLFEVLRGHGHVLDRDAVSLVGACTPARTLSMARCRAARCTASYLDATEGHACSAWPH